MQTLTNQPESIRAAIAAHPNFLSINLGQLSTRQGSVINNDEALWKFVHELGVSCDQELLELFPEADKVILASEMAKWCGIAKDNVLNGVAISSACMNMFSAAVTWMRDDCFQVATAESAGGFLWGLAPLVRTSTTRLPEEICKILIDIVFNFTIRQKQSERGMDILPKSGALEVVFKCLTYYPENIQIIQSSEKIFTTLTEENPGVLRQYFKSGSSCREALETAVSVTKGKASQALLAKVLSVVEVLRPTASVSESPRGGLLRICGTCSNAPSEGLLACGKCKLVFYCNRECQTKGWKEHKKICGAAINEMSIANAVKANRQLCFEFMKLHYPQISEKMRLLRRSQVPPVDVQDMVLWIDVQKKEFGVELLSQVMQGQRLPPHFLYEGTEVFDKNLAMLRQNLVATREKLEPGMVLSIQWLAAGLDVVRTAMLTPDRSRSFFTNDLLDDELLHRTILHISWPNLH